MSYILNLGGRAFDLSEPVVMGILNVTPDSFYAGSRKQTAEAIAERTHEIVQEESWSMARRSYAGCATH